MRRRLAMVASAVTSSAFLAGVLPSAFALAACVIAVDVGLRGRALATLDGMALVILPLLVTIAALATSRLPRDGARSDGVVIVMSSTLALSVLLWLGWRVWSASIEHAGPASSEAEADVRRVVFHFSGMLPLGMAGALLVTGAALAGASTQGARGRALALRVGTVALGVLTCALARNAYDGSFPALGPLFSLLPRAVHWELPCAFSLAGCVAMTVLATWVAHVRDEGSAGLAMAALTVGATAVVVGSFGALHAHAAITWSCGLVLDQYAMVLDRGWSERFLHLGFSSIALLPAAPVAVALLRRGALPRGWLGPLRVAIVLVAMIAIAHDFADRTFESRIEAMADRLREGDALGPHVDMVLEDGVLRPFDHRSAADAIPLDRETVTFDEGATAAELLHALPDGSGSLCLVSRRAWARGGLQPEHPRLRSLHALVRSCIRFGQTPRHAARFALESERDLEALATRAREHYASTPTRDVVLSVPPDLPLAVLAPATDSLVEPWVELRAE